MSNKHYTENKGTETPITPGGVLKWNAVPVPYVVFFDRT
jgi:hypothetical protein